LDVRGDGRKNFARNVSRPDRLRRIVVVDWGQWYG
jgi:hypothetical protein